MTDRDTLVRIETQVARFVSDIESEKRTRADSHTRIHQRLDEIEARVSKRFDATDVRMRKSEFFIAMAIGGLGMLNVLSVALGLLVIFKKLPLP